MILKILLRYVRFLFVLYVEDTGALHPAALPQGTEHVMAEYRFNEVPFGRKTPEMQNNRLRTDTKKKRKA